MPKLYGWPGKPAGRLDLREVRRELIGDSIERKALVERLIHVVREDERNRVLGNLDAARDRAARERS